MTGSEGPQVNLGGVKTRTDLVKVLEKTTPKTIQEDLKYMIIQYLRESNSQEEEIKSLKAISKSEGGNEALQRIQELE